MNEAPHVAPAALPPSKPPPNGFTRWVRRSLSVACAVLLIGMISAASVGSIDWPPFHVLALVTLIAVFATQPGVDALQAILGAFGGRRL